MNLRERMTLADTLLAPYAVQHEGTLGRDYPEPDDATRFPFQRDRDRIIHSLSFRRLKGKTQVFVAGEGDHYRTRLTHTLEVAQVSRDIARTLMLNEDVAECIALAHDLGHPPFGHGGEHAIDEWMRAHGSTFEHNMQSYRIVTILEQHSVQFPGLNLNREVLQGMLKHMTPHDHPSGDTLPEGAGHTLEAQTVNLADEIAYTAHDCDDGLREGLFSIQDILQIPLARVAVDHSRERGTSLRGALIDLMVTDLYDESMGRLKEVQVRTLDDVRLQRSPLIGFSEQFRTSVDQLREFLWTSMYLHPLIEQRVVEGQKIIEKLCTHLHKHPSQKIIDLQKKTDSTVVEAVKDYVAGMTDTFAVELAADLKLL